ncbi:MAG: hypothetical protein QW091_01100 [Candidatus Micrarchaeaceae archaeon]
MVKSGKLENKAAVEKSAKKAKNSMLIAIAIAVPVLIVFFALVLLLRAPGVPFTVFKGNFYGASSASIVATYSNESEFVSEADCVGMLRELIHFRNTSDVHVFFINSTNSSCIFSPTVTNITLQIKPASYCLRIANSEPSIFLNYSSINVSTVTAYKLTIYGNTEYMQRCPIAIDMS